MGAIPPATVITRTNEEMEVLANTRRFGFFASPNLESAWDFGYLGAKLMTF